MHGAWLPSMACPVKKWWSGHLVGLSPMESFVVVHNEYRILVLKNHLKIILKHYSLLYLVSLRSSVIFPTCSETLFLQCLTVLGLTWIIESKALKRLSKILRTLQKLLIDNYIDREKENGPFLGGRLPNNRPSKSFLWGWEVSVNSPPTTWLCVCLCGREKAFHHPKL